MLGLHRRFHSCGLPDKPLPEIKAQDLAANGASISVSHLGSKKVALEMLQLAAEKGVSEVRFCRGARLMSVGHDVEGGVVDEGCWQGDSGRQGEQGSLPLRSQAGRRRLHN